MVQRAVIGPIPGWLVVTMSIIFYVILLLLAVITRRAEDKELLLGITLTEAKQWLEKATTYAFFIAGISTMYVLSSPNRASFILPMSSVLLAFLLFRGGSYYRLWTRALIRDSAASTYTKFGWKAVGLRLRRTYLLAFILLFSCWLSNLYLAPLPARDFNSFVERATVGLIPGWLSLISFTILYMGLFVFAFISFRAEK